jgi:hypothetical protein
MRAYLTCGGARGVAADERPYGLKSEAGSKDGSAHRQRRKYDIPGRLESPLGK